MTTGTTSVISTMTEVPGCEITTLQNKSTNDTGADLQNEQEENPIMIIIQSLISGLNLFTNLLLIRALQNLPNSKLRKSTRLLICYVSASYCLGIMLPFTKLVKLPCFVTLFNVINMLVNTVSGMLFLCTEAFIMVQRPHNHHKYISLRVCKVAIGITCLVSIGIDVLAYVTSKDPDDTRCYITNGIFNPWFVCFFVSFIGIIVTMTSVLQISVLRSMKKVLPQNRPVHMTVTSAQIVPLGVHTNQPVATMVPKKNSAFRNAMIMMTMSIACWIICWCPSLICGFVFSLCETLGIQIVMERQIAGGVGGLAALSGIFHATVYIGKSRQIGQAVVTYLKSWACW